MKRLLYFLVFLGITISSLYGQSTWMVSGSFSYFNASSTPMDVVKVVLKQGTSRVDSVMTDATGHYAFTEVANGIYVVLAYTSKPWNSVNATDAVKVQRHFAGLEIITEPVKLQAADVNLSNSINATDAVKIKRRFSGLDNYFDRGDWTIAKPSTESDTIIVNGANIIQDFYILCVGDVNGSNIPSPTQELAVVTTAPITNLSQTSATSGGDVFSDGGLTVTSRGMCWSTTPSPTTLNSFTIDGSGTGTFVSNLSALSQGTLYYARAFATNSAGTAYGNELSFTTLHVWQCGDQITYEGKTYNTVQIGDQCWFKENLNVGTKINGSQAQANNSIKEKWCYNDLESNCDVYGGLYQWAELVQYLNGATTINSWNPIPTTNVIGLCPSGWHVPADGELTTLTNYLGGLNIAGGPLKEAGTARWSSPNTGATNGSGFTALPGGTFGDNWGDQFYCLHEQAWFWSSTDFNWWTAGAWGRILYYNTTSVFRPNYDLTYKGNGLSVRCLKDGSSSLSTLTTNPVSNITQTTATSGGYVTSDGGATVTARGVCWSTSSNPTIASNHTTDGTGVGSFLSNITGLTGGTLYYVRAYSTNSVGTAYGNEVTITTLDWQCGDQITYEGKTYNTVQIGNQCWFKENLNVGNRIIGSQAQANNSIKEKWCYNDLESNCDVYGGLYQWAEAVQYLNGATNTTSWNPVPTADVVGLCPAGWHLPSDGEWTTLTTYLGGWTIAGGKVKESGTTHWLPPNTGATNESGFTALPGGMQHTTGGFVQLTYQAFFWMSSESSGNAAYMRYLGYSSANLIWEAWGKDQGFSVRCVKD